MQWSTSSPQTRFTVWDLGLCDILSKVPARRRQAFRVFCCHIFKKSEYLLSTSFYQHVWFLGLHSRSPAVMSAGICFLLFASLCICCVDLHGCVWMCMDAYGSPRCICMDLHDGSSWSVDQFECPCLFTATWYSALRRFCECFFFRFSVPLYFAHFWVWRDGSSIKVSPLVGCGNHASGTQICHNNRWNKSGQGTRHICGHQIL